MARGVSAASEAGLYGVKYACGAGGHGTGMCRECACFGIRLQMEQQGSLMNASDRERDVAIPLEMHIHAAYVPHLLICILSCLFIDWIANRAPSQEFVTEFRPRASAPATLLCPTPGHAPPCSFACRPRHRPRSPCQCPPTRLQAMVAAPRQGVPMIHPTQHAHRPTRFLLTHACRHVCQASPPPGQRRRGCALAQEGCQGTKVAAAAPGTRKRPA